MLFRLVRCDSRGDRPVNDGINEVIRIPQLTKDSSSSVHTLLRNAPKMTIAGARYQAWWRANHTCSGYLHGYDSAGVVLCLSAYRKPLFQHMVCDLEAAPQGKGASHFRTSHFRAFHCIVESTVPRILPSAIADSIRPTGSRLAHLYGLPKTPKRQLAMRPILSATGTYNYTLAKWLDAKLKPLSVNEHTITDIFHPHKWNLWN